MKVFRPDHLQGDIAKALVCLAATAFLSSCSSPGVKLLDKPVSSSESVATLFDSGRLTPAAEAFLNSRNLLPAYRKDPSGTLAGLGKTASGELSAADRVALAELCSDTAQGFAGESRSKALGYFLAAADVSYEGLRFKNGKPVDPDLQRIYNFSTGQAAGLAFAAGKTAVAATGPWGDYRVSWEKPGDGILSPAFLDRLEPASFLKVRLAHDTSVRRTVEGFGDAMVGYRDFTEERAKKNPLLSGAGMALPLAATAEFSGSGGGVRLALHELLEEDTTRINGQNVRLSADYTAPLMTLYNFSPIAGVGYKGMFHPSKYQETTGLHALEPFRKDKIPLFFVHGLGSEPSTWVDAFNMVWGDKVLREKYQIIHYTYTTGFPVAYDAAQFRHRMNQFLTEFKSPLMDQMVMVGHSMGGVMTSSQIRNSGDAMLDLFFSKPLEEIDGFSAKEKEGFRKMMVYEANPYLSRAVFMAAVHRGSEIAASPIGKIGSALVHLPGAVIKPLLPVEEIDGLTETGRQSLGRIPNGIEELKPHDPVLENIVNQPIGKGVTYHSVIGRANPSQALADSSDKVVPYWSSHLDGAASEKIVHATHTQMTWKPDSLAELRRILYLHVGMSLD